MRRFELRDWVLVGLVLAVGACGSIPNDSGVNADEAGGSTYTDSDWGFQITLPDPDTWGYSGQTLYQERYSNGLPRTEVRFTHVPEGGGSGFLPSLVVRPQVLSADGTVDAFAQTTEQLYRSQFMGYRSGAKSYYRIGDVEVVEWVFTTRPLRSVGDRFLIAVMKDGRKGYLLLGSGLFSDFPVDGYKQMISGMRFN